MPGPFDNITDPTTLKALVYDLLVTQEQTASQIQAANARLAELAIVPLTADESHAQRAGHNGRVTTPPNRATRRAKGTRKETATTGE